MSPDGRFLAGPVLEVPGLWVAEWLHGSLRVLLVPGDRGSAGRVDRDRPAGGHVGLASSWFGPLADEVLVERGVWQYAHDYSSSAS